MYINRKHVYRLDDLNRHIRSDDLMQISNDCECVICYPCNFFILLKVLFFNRKEDKIIIEIYNNIA